MRMEAGLVGTQRCRLCFYSSCITGPKQSHVKCFRVPHVWLIEVDFPGYLLVSTSTLCPCILGSHKRLSTASGRLAG
jgi:hypothetical protein